MMILRDSDGVLGLRQICVVSNRTMYCARRFSLKVNWRGYGGYGGSFYECS